MTYGLKPCNNTCIITRRWESWRLRSYLLLKLIKLHSLIYPIRPGCFKRRALQSSTRDPRQTNRTEPAPIHEFNAALTPGPTAMPPSRLL